MPTSGRKIDRDLIICSHRGIAYWGIWLMLGSLLLHVTGGVFEKLLLGIYPAPQMVFVRTITRLIPLTLVLLKQTEIKQILAVKQPFCHFFRLAAYILYNYGMLFALSKVSLTVACSLQYVTPFFTILLSAFFLKEKISIQTWIVIGISSFGVLIAIQPNLEFQTFSFLILFSSFMGSFNKVLIRRLVATEHTLSITLYGNLVMAVVLIPSILFEGWHSIAWVDMGCFMIAGILTASAQYASVQALRYSQASALAPLDYTSLIWAVLFDLFIWGVIPNSYLILGTIILIGSNLYLILSTRGLSAPSKSKKRGQVVE